MQICDNLAKKEAIGGEVLRCEILWLVSHVIHGKYVCQKVDIMRD